MPGAVAGVIVLSIAERDPQALKRRCFQAQCLFSLVISSLPREWFL